MLTKNNTGLIIVDIQGKLARMVHESEQLIAHCKQLITGANILDLPIIWLEQNPEKIGKTINDISMLLTDQTPITKYTFDACENPSFMKAVSDANINHWLICGIEAHICVYQSALHLQQSGYSVQLVSDCISSRSLNNKELAVNKLISRGVDITSVEMCLFELVKDCRANEFKEILQLIR